MHPFKLFWIFLLGLPLLGSAQIVEIEKNRALNESCESAVMALYAWDFEKADLLLNEISPQAKNHPVVPFLKALQAYWEEAPIAPGSNVFNEYWSLVQEAESKADKLWAEHKKSPELTFFRLLINMLVARYYDETGETMKAVGKTRKAYDLIKKGFKYTKTYPEFTFTTGLYNFYREAYPDKYPVYKPFAWFFQSGDRELGLAQLKEAAHNNVYTGPEATRFLTYIYRVYENDPQQSVHFAKQAHERFPDNKILLQEYIEALLINGVYSEISSLVASFEAGTSKAYYSFAASIFKGMYEELYTKDYEKAFEHYQSALSQANELKSEGKYLMCYLYAGLSKCYEEKDQLEAKHYLKQAKKYDFNAYLEVWEGEG